MSFQHTALAFSLSHCDTHNNNIGDVNNCLFVKKWQATGYHRGTACWWFEQVITNDAIIALRRLGVFSQINSDVIRWCRYSQQRQSCDTITTSISCSRCCQQCLIFLLWNENLRALWWWDYVWSQKTNRAEINWLKGNSIKGGSSPRGSHAKKKESLFNPFRAHPWSIQTTTLLLYSRRTVLRRVSF